MWETYVKRRAEVQRTRTGGAGVDRRVRIIVASPSIDAAIVRKLFLTPAATPQEALDTALKMARKRKPTVLFFPQAQRTLPIFNNTPK